MARIGTIIWEQWKTEQDDGVCPECGPLHNQYFERGQGPQPPLHYLCRCRRVYSHTEIDDRPRPVVPNPMPGDEDDEEDGEA